jgi:hypothetical protein
VARVARSATGDRELERATHSLERLYQLAGRRVFALVLAIAYERIERLDAARQLVDRVHRDEEPLPERAMPRLTALEERLAARAGGAPRTDDPALRKWLIDQAAYFEAAQERLRLGTVHSRD